MQVLHELVLVVADQQRLVLGDDPLHPVDRDQLRVLQVNDDLLNRPHARHRERHQVRARQAGDGVLDLLAAGFETIDEGLVVHNSQ